MDNSQNSDVFSDLTNQSCTSASYTMYVNGYESLLNNTKASLTRNFSALTNPSICDYFASLLEDCRLCITQALNLLNEILSESHVPAQKLEHYLEDVVTVLHLFSNFIKKIVEPVSISCCMMKTFPTTTGQIIMDTFTHCKNSETVYGVHLTSVQQKLKDLFRTSHELQLTYLMVLEKHFVFDLSEKEELDILVEALNINLQIGEVVQALDVKTMAEQWKAYTVICDKYSSYLMDTLVYQDCTTLLCTMVVKNLKIALEVEQDEKFIVRSMKVTNFTIKILTKMFTIFKHAQEKPYQCIVEFLITVHLYNPPYLETMKEKSPQFINIMLTNVSNPVDMLLNELLNDENFVNVILNYNFNNIRQNDEFLGYVFLIAALMKSASQKNNKNILPKSKLIHCLLQLLPDCYVWMNMDMKFEIDSSQHKMKPVGLFEYLLLHVTYLALKMSCDEYCLLEKTMCEAILSVDTVRALFASNLWIILTRNINNKQLLLSQLISLCQMYQKLESVKLFSRSPQKVHLTNTMSSLFDIADVEDRVIIYKHFNPLISSKNIPLWSVLRIKKLPIEFQRTVEEDIVDKFKTEFQKFTSGFQYKESFDVVTTMKLAATCSINALEGVEDILLEAWAWACPKNLLFLSDVLPINMMWFLDYIEALVSLTCAMKYTVYGRSSYVIKLDDVYLFVTALKEGAQHLWGTSCTDVDQSGAYASLSGVTVVDNMIHKVTRHASSALHQKNVFAALLLCNPDPDNCNSEATSCVATQRNASSLLRSENTNKQNREEVLYLDSLLEKPILHVISGLANGGNTELKLLVMDLLCKLAANQIHDENKTEAAKITNEAFKTLVQDTDALMRNTFLSVVRKCDNKDLDQIVSTIVCGDKSLLEVWQHFMNENDKAFSKTKLKEHLALVNNYKYRHKCVEYKEEVKYSVASEEVKYSVASEEVKCSVASVKKQNSSSSNFEFADIDSLFDNNESDGEPASKKVKFDTNEVETILDRLEQDTSSLCDIKENVFTYKYKKRIRLLSERLLNIVTNE